MRWSLLTLLFLIAPACSPAQRTAAGAGIGGVGLATTALAVRSMATCNSDEPPSTPCQSPGSKPTSRSSSILVALGGVGLMIAGGAMIVNSHDGGEPPQIKPPAPPVAAAEPSQLDASTALIMALAELATRDLTGEHKLPRKLESIEHPGSLDVLGGRAELSNLRVRRAAGEGPVVLTACFVYGREWRLVRLGEGPCNW